MVVRVEVRGVGPRHPAELMNPHWPLFTLYGDGRVIRAESRVRLDLPILTTFTVTRISATGIRTVLEEARAAGVWGDDRDLRFTGVADGRSTYVRVVTDRGEHVTSAYDLWDTYGLEELTGGMRDARESLQRLLDELADLEEWLPEEVLDGPEPFEPERWAAVWARDPDPEETYWTAEFLHGYRVLPWPLEPLAEWGEPRPDWEGLRCALVEGEDLEELRRQLDDDTLWESGGVIHYLYARPLLPDEDSCWEAHA